MTREEYIAPTSTVTAQNVIVIECPEPVEPDPTILEYTIYRNLDVPVVQDVVYDKGGHVPFYKKLEQKGGKKRKRRRY